MSSTPCARRATYNSLICLVIQANFAAWHSAVARCAPPAAPKKRAPTMRLSLVVRFAVIGFGLLVASPLYAQKEEASEAKEGEEKSEESSSEGEGEKAEDE